MKKHWKKVIAPVIIIAIAILYYVLIGIVFFTIDAISIPMKIIGLIFPVAFIAVCIFVLKERIQEIRSGEEDDIGKY